MARPVKYTPDLLRELLTAMVSEPHTGPKKIAKKNHVSPATFYQWQRQSAEHEKAGLTESPWLIEWLDNVSWFHRHCQFCRAVSIAQIDARIIEGATCSRLEPLFNPQTGSPFWEVDPKIASDAKLLDDDTWHLIYGLDRDKSDIYKRNDAGELIQAHREVPPNPQLLMKAAASLLSATYGETVTHQVQIGGVLRIGSSTPAPSLPPPVDVDFLQVDDVQAPQQTNVLAVAERPKSVQEFEETFGGRRLVEAVLFYDENGTLLPPLTDIVIVQGSEVDRLYTEAGIEHATTPASELLAQGYCNNFLLALAKPAELVLVKELRAKLAAGVKHPLPTHPVQKFKPGDEPVEEPQPPEPDIQNHPRAYYAPASQPLRRVDSVNRIDGGEQIGYGRPPPGGRSVIN
jgi:hypothetical protein